MLITRRVARDEVDAGGGEGEAHRRAVGLGNLFSRERTTGEGEAGDGRRAGAVAPQSMTRPEPSISSSRKRAPSKTKIS